MAMMPAANVARIARIAAVLSVIVLWTSCESETEARVIYGATLTGDKVKPAAVTTGGSGTFALTVTGGAVFTYTLDFQNLSSAAVAANIRGPAADTDTAVVVVDLNNVPATLGSGSATLGGTSGNASGTFRITGAVAPGFGADSLRKLMDAGLLYVSVETANNPAGEIRGQIGRQ
jgi:hypothetical protein